MSHRSEVAGDVVFGSRTMPPSRRRGAQTVEFAVLLPVMIMLLVGGIELARMNMLRHVIDNASYEAARCVVVPGATASEAQSKAIAILSTMGAKNAVISVSPNPILESTSKVSVKVSVPAKGNVWGLNWFSSGLTLDSETRLMTERGPLQQSKAAIIPPPPPPPEPIIPSTEVVYDTIDSLLQLIEPAPAPSPAPTAPATPSVGL